jgi:hypothetical protein
MAKKVFTHNLSEPLNGATTAKYMIQTDSGNLAIDRLTSGEPLLASGTLEYLENQGQPTRSLSNGSGQAYLSLKTSSARQPWFRFPWDACNGAIRWQIHLNPAIPADITASSGGGNVRLDLTGLAVTHVTAETGGGNVEVALPDSAADLSVTAKTGAGAVTLEVGRITGSSAIDASSGAGNVVVNLPGGLAARIHATSGIGKVIMDPRFGKIEANIYQSPDFNSAIDLVEITLKSGAGNVTVSTR